MTMAKVPYRLFLFVFVAVLGLFLYLTIDREVLLLRLNQLPIEVESRVEHWDWKETDDEVFCRNLDGASSPRTISRDPIPNVVHFIFLAAEGHDVELSYAQFLAIKAAVVRMEASEIKLSVRPHIPFLEEASLTLHRKSHTYSLNTSNSYWTQLQHHVTLVPIDRNALPGPHGLETKSLQLAHQADLLRMDILMREGGIYLDSDVFVLKPFTDLLASPRDILMGHEGGNRYGLCNAVIVARRGSEFMGLWRESYKSFDPKAWNDHSVLRPKLLAVQHPDLICPLSPSVFLWPTWSKRHTRYMTEVLTKVEEKETLLFNMTTFGGAMYENQLSIHSWGMHDYLAQLTPEDIMEKDTRFNLLLKDVATAKLSWTPSKLGSL